MRITCPQCGFFRDLPDTKAPVTPTMATCPKCRHRFRFRPEPVAAASGGLYAAGEDGVSSWRRASPAKQDKPHPPSAAWEPMDADGDAPDEGAPETGADALPEMADATFAEPSRPPRSRGRDLSPPAGSDPSAETREWAAPADAADAGSLPPPSHWDARCDPAGTDGRRDDAPLPGHTRAPDRFLDEVSASSAASSDPVASDCEVPPVAAPRTRPAVADPDPDPDPEPVVPGRMSEVAAASRPVPAADPIAEPIPPVAAPPPPPPREDLPPPAVDPEPVSPSVVRPGPETGRTRNVEDDGPDAPPDQPPVQKPAASGSRADGVRDIWARLQAMDDRKPRKSRPEHQRPAEDEPEEQPRETVTDPIPWERQEAYGFFPGLGLTLRKILLHPVEFFESMPEGRPKAKALVFNLLISELLLVLDFMWSLFGLRARLGGPEQPEVMGALGASSGLGFLVALLLVPLIISVGIYVDAWITHLLLLLFRSAKKGFNETFRVLCYSAAPTVLSAVPVAGQLLSPIILIWYMALQAIGLKKCHEAAYTQTLAAIFIKWSLYLFVLLALLQSFAPGQ
ncbi:YIP1 family protein [Solidesulfovibrio sp.]